MPSDDTPEPRRWRRRKDERPQEIVAAALAVFAERGFAAARLDDVAARAGVSKGTLYLYFPSKEELFKAVVRAAILPNLERAERLVDGAPGATFALLDRILAMMGEVIATTQAAIIPKLVIAEAGNFPELAAFYHQEVVQRGLALLARLLERGVARGEFRPLPIDHAARLIVAPLLMCAMWRSAFDAVAPLDVSALIATHRDHLRRVLLVTEDTA